MAKYIQTSTANPYGHTPWQTALYTSFGDFAWLKQPQNAIERESPAIRPRVRKPPELAGDVIVGGSGRVLGLGLFNVPFFNGGRTMFYNASSGTGNPPLYMRAPTPVAPVRVAAPPIYIRPPASVPVPPVRVAVPGSGVYSYVPGAPGQAGSPFPPAAGAAPAAAAPAPSFLDEVSAWLTGSMIAGIPNWIIGGGVLLLVATRDSRKGRF